MDLWTNQKIYSSGANFRLTQDGTKKLADHLLNLNPFQNGVYELSAQKISQNFHQTTVQAAQIEIFWSKLPQQVQT